MDRAPVTALRRSLGFSFSVSGLQVAAAVALTDIIAFALIRLAGAGLELSQALSFACAVGIGVLLLRRAGVAGAEASGATSSIRIGDALVVLALAYMLRAGVLSLLALQHHWPPLAAIVPTALTGVLVAGLGAPFFLRGDANEMVRGNARLASAVALCVAYLLALRLVFIGQVELVPQEAYYWNYAQHPDIGYVDHPPLVAWLIGAATLLGPGEFFVRITAVASWIVMLVFTMLYVRDIAGIDAARRATLLACTLPYFFIIGVIVTPDAPLAAAWAAALYFLRRALLAGERGAWLGAGLAIGVGMLSKYTMALVPLAAFAFVLLDAKSRRVLVSPWAWGGAALSLAIFAPVIVWNMQHGWASFTFQSVRRLADVESRFSLHVLIGWVLLLVTPWGIVAFARAFLRARRVPRAGAIPAEGVGRFAGREGRFILVFTAIPLVVFMIASLSADTKLHWTGPIWIAALPAIAAGFAPMRGGPRARIDRALARSFEPLVHGLMIFFAFAMFYYPVWGLAGIRAHHAYFQMGWRDLRAQVQVIEDAVLAETGTRPAIVGLDKHNTADEMAYYDPRGDGARDTASRHLFLDSGAVMYEFWFPRRVFEGRDLVVVSRSREDLDGPTIHAHATRVGEIRPLTVHKSGARVGQYFARVVYGYRSTPR